MGRFLTRRSVSLAGSEYSNYLFPLDWASAVCVFKEIIYFVYLNCPNLWTHYLLYFFIIYLIQVGSGVTSSLSFLYGNLCFLFCQSVWSEAYQFHWTVCGTIYILSFFCFQFHWFMVFLFHSPICFSFDLFFSF